MQIAWSLATKSALLTLLMAMGSMAAAQTGRPWVDPPGVGSTAPSRAPEPQAPEAVRPAPAAPPQAAAPPPPTPAAPSTQTAQPQTPVFRPDTPATRQAQQPEVAPAPPAPAPATPAPVTTARPKQDPTDDKRE